ncbi:hypothetical protein CCP2SC5_230009 [Azospirillaceae bacterium]
MMGNTSLSYTRGGAAVVAVCLAWGFGAQSACAEKLLIDQKVGQNETSAVIALPASKVPTTEKNPPCGEAPNTVEDIAKAVIGLGNISVGVPLLEASKYINIDPALTNTLRTLTGALNGKASCAQICVELPLAVTNVDVDAYGRKVGAPAWSKLEFNAEASIGAALVEKPKFTKAANGYVICAVAKNWKHDEERDFKLTVTYDKK